MACTEHSTLGNASLQITSDNTTTECDLPIIEPRGSTTRSSGDSNIAIDANGLSKAYTLYPSPRAQILDMVGFYRLGLRRRPDFPHHSALNGIDLRIERGERVGLIGRNGAGKTTLLKIITGAAEPDAGSLVVNGNVQALMQAGLGFHPEFSGRENIHAALQYSGFGTHERRLAEDDIIAFCELGEYLQQPLKTYSLGMQSRLQFACATAIKPEILIVDEILGAGDAYFAVKSSQRMEMLTKSGCTLLLVSHSMQQVIQFCERCLWIDAGRIVQDGKVRDVATKYEQFMFDISKGLRDGEVVTKSSRSFAKSTGKPDAAGSERTSEEALSTDKSASVSGHVDGDRSSPTKPIPEWYRGQLATQMGLDAKEAQAASSTSGWVNDSRLRIVGANLTAKEGKSNRHFIVGDPLTLEITIEAQVDGQFECWFVALIYSDDGRPLARHVSEKKALQLSARSRTKAQLHYDELRLGAGEYHASVAIYKRWNPSDRTTANWYEILNRSVEFRVDAVTEFDPSLFHHPASWSFTNEGLEP
jgi:lipopolysaccharide transport system ATP-binding protein